MFIALARKSICLHGLVGGIIARAIEALGMVDRFVVCVAHSLSFYNYVYSLVLVSSLSIACLRKYIEWNFEAAS